MRRRVAFGAVTVIGFVATANAAIPATTASGQLTGQTQISFGCPGPARVGAPGCNPWRPFAHAHFELAERGANGAIEPGTRRLVSSNQLGRFALRLRVGSYLLTTVPQRNTRGGTNLSVRVQADQTSTVLVRFTGFPLME
jgi:hypothetical protein